jgi:hypothetical protein
MENKILKTCRQPMLAAGLALALVIPAMAVDVQQSTELSYNWVVDWSATSSWANHLNYASFTAAEHPRGVTPKFLDFDISNDFPGARGHCFEMATSYGPSAKTADTEILIKTDDGENGCGFPTILAAPAFPEPDSISTIMPSPNNT